MTKFDGTIESLIAHYKAHRVSGYRDIRSSTRKNYDALCRRLIKDHGDVILAGVKYVTALEWHDTWMTDSGVSSAHGLVAMLRILVGFGATILEDNDCARLSLVLRKLRCPQAKPREEAMTADQADAIRAKAHEMGRPSIALAQALQFECILRQKDVIGEYVPVDEERDDESDIIVRGKKWLRGLRWTEIDGGLVLKHETSKKGKVLELDLHHAPMVMDELERLTVRPLTGPVIINEDTGQPYLAHQFRYRWRLIATAAGVPRGVWNMDSRAGGITEATEAGADIEHVKHAATHSDISMTQRYSRGRVQKIAKVQLIRNASRVKK